MCGQILLDIQRKVESVYEVKEMCIRDRIGMQIESQGKDMLIVSERGMGKRTDMDEFTRQNRGGKGRCV